MLYLLSSRLKIGREPVHDTLDVFFENTLPHDASEISEPFVFSGLESRNELLAVHNIGLDEDDWTFIKTIRQQVASPDVPRVPHAFRVRTGISVGRKTRNPGHRCSHGFRAS